MNNRGPRVVSTASWTNEDAVSMDKQANLMLDGVDRYLDSQGRVQQQMIAVSSGLGAIDAPRKAPVVPFLNGACTHRL